MQQHRATLVAGLNVFTVMCYVLSDQHQISLFFGEGLIQLSLQSMTLKLRIRYLKKLVTYC